MFYKSAKTITGTNVRKFRDERAMFTKKTKLPCFEYPNLSQQQQQLQV